MNYRLDGAPEHIPRVADLCCEPKLEGRAKLGMATYEKKQSNSLASISGALEIREFPKPNLVEAKETIPEWTQSFKRGEKIVPFVQKEALIFPAKVFSFRR